jgi:hypothetical protein
MKLGRRDHGAFLAMAVAGVLAGGVGCTKEEPAPAGGGAGGGAGSKEAPKAPDKKAPAAGEEKHACKGLNSCANKGGCKTGDNGCKGKNSCKGKGGCAVPAK